jgi:cell volume regulation protein A
MIVLITFAAIALVILLGFAGNFFFQKTMVPDIIWLVLLGIFLGPVFNVIDPTIFSAAIPFFTAIAIMIILFEGGLNTNIFTLIRESPRSILLATTTILLTMGATGLFMTYVLEWPLINGILLGAILGGSSSPIIISITSKIKGDEEVKTLLNIESTLTDALCIILAIVVAEIIAYGTYVPTDIANRILGSFSIGAALGFVTGVVAILLLSTFKRKPFGYMLTLALLLLLYSFTESVGGSGAIASLIFGVVIANPINISNMLKIRRKIIIDKNVRRFHREVAFLIRTFFFVYLGVLLTVGSASILMLGIVLTFVLLGVRFLTVYASTIKMGIFTAEKMLMGVLIPRGLAAAVLTQIPLTYGIVHASTYTDLIIIVIIASIVVTTVGVASLRRGLYRANMNHKRNGKSKKMPTKK